MEERWLRSCRRSICLERGGSRRSGIYCGKGNSVGPSFERRNAWLNWLSLSLATWTQRPHFFLSKKQVGTWKVCSMPCKGSSELCPRLQPVLKSEPVRSFRTGGIFFPLLPFKSLSVQRLYKVPWSGKRDPPKRIYSLSRSDALKKEVVKTQIKRYLQLYDYDI